MNLNKVTTHRSGTDLADGEVGRELLRRISSGNSLEFGRLRMPPETHLDGVPHATGTVEHLLVSSGHLISGAANSPPTCTPATGSPSPETRRTSTATAPRRAS
ncbi:hypothetical protein [Streptomyces sp. NPDC004230]